MSDTVPVYTVTLWQRLKLFLHPPKSVQAECYKQPWVGVTEDWCARVQARFDHQEKRAAAIAMLEKEGAKLRGDGGPVLLADGLRASLANTVTDKGEPFGKICPHDHRLAEHVQYCCDCQTILARDARAMIPPDELEALRAVNAQMNEIALWMRVNMEAEITRGDHAGKSDAQVIIGYLSRLKATPIPA